MVGRLYGELLCIFFPLRLADWLHKTSCILLTVYQWAGHWKLYFFVKLIVCIGNLCIETKFFKPVRHFVQFTFFSVFLILYCIYFLLPTLLVASVDTYVSCTFLHCLCIYLFILTSYFYRFCQTWNFLRLHNNVMVMLIFQVSSEAASWFESSIPHSFY